MFQTSCVFAANHAATEPIVVNQGGTWSGKTYSIDQNLFTKAISEKCVITIVGQSVPNLKSGAYRDAQNIVADSKQLASLISSHNKTDRVYEFRSGSVMEFKSYLTSQDAKSGKRDYLFINEAQGISPAIYYELQLRTNKQTFIDYNPNAGFWVHDTVIGKPGVKLIISDHRHNPFISQAQHDKIEAIEDKELWKVYARGLTGKIEGLIFRNWSRCEAIPDGAKLVAHGLDFGFTNDPSACVSVYLQDGELWLNERLYEYRMTNPDLSKYFNEQGITGEIVADSAEPKSIKELQNERHFVQPANKGADSVKSSIDILKRYKINVTNSSVNLIKELNSYKWKVERGTDRVMNEPVDFMNHLIDALRYVALNKLAVSNSGNYTIL